LHYAACLTCRDIPNNLVQADPWHPLSCNSLKRGEITARHDSVVKIIARYTNFAGGIPIVEATRVTEESRTRPDLQILLPGQHYLSDVKVTHPLCPSHVSRYWRKQLGSANAGEVEKTKKYSALADQCKAEFIPFVVEPHGGFSKKSEQLLSNIILASVEHQSLWSPEEIKTELYGTIAIAVQRGNTLIMDAGYHTTLREAGRMECSIGGIIEAAG